MEEKVVQFDLAAEKLLEMADARLDEGDHLAALRLLHKSLELYGPARTNTFPSPTRTTKGNFRAFRQLLVFLSGYLPRRGGG